jgi:hypothetical protein
VHAVPAVGDAQHSKTPYSETVLIQLYSCSADSWDDSDEEMQAKTARAGAKRKASRTAATAAVHIA